MAALSGRSPARGALALLLLAYIFNYVDRQIVSVLAIPIKSDLALSDTQLGLMGGLAFSLFYTSFGIPVARLADRYSRVSIISISLALWSLFTALCGLAQNFVQLLLARMGVGIGEAGGVAPSYALIPDLVPAEWRSRAMAIFSFGIPLGSALGIFFGGWIASHIDWRTAFLAVGIGGLLIAPLIRLGIREPERRTAGGAPAARAPSFSETMRVLRSKPSLWLMSVANGSGAIAGYGLLFWLPSYFQRSLGLQLFEISLFYGTIVLLGGLGGIWLGGWLGDRIGGRSVRAYALVPAVAVAAAAPLNAVALFTSWLPLAFFLFLIPNGLGLAWAGPITAAVQQVVPPQMRATASAIFLFFTNLMGLGFGTFLLGFLSDSLTGRLGDDALRYAILCGLGFYMLSGLLYFLASFRLPRDWHQD